METVNTFRMSSSMTTALSATMKVLLNKVTELEKKITTSNGKLFFSPIEAADFVGSLVDDSKALDNELKALAEAYNECAQVLMPFMVSKEEKAFTEIPKSNDLLSVPDFLAKQPGNLITAKSLTNRIRCRGGWPVKYEHRPGRSKVALWAESTLQEAYDNIPNRQVIASKKVSVSDFLDGYEFSKDQTRNMQLRANFRSHILALGLEGEFDTFRIKVYSLQKLERALNNWAQINSIQLVKK